MPDEEVQRWIDLSHDEAYRVVVEGRKNATHATVRLLEPANNRPVTSYYDASAAQTQRLIAAGAADQRQ
jgi:hypothetical protein